MGNSTIHRHCERSEAIHSFSTTLWIASSQVLLAMTANACATSELPCNGLQHAEQRGAVGGAEQFVEPRLVLGGDQLLGARQYRAAFVGQNEDVRAPIIGGADPRAEIAA